MASGKLLVFEGMDGSGKTTLSKAVARALAATRDRELVRTSSVRWATFPDAGNPIGQLIRSTFTGTTMISKAAMLWLFTAEAVEAEPYLQQCLREGLTLVLDRHTLCSAQVYQAEVHPAALIRQVQDWGHFVPPDFLFIVDVPPEIAVQRAQRRSKPVDQMFESADAAEFLAMLAQRRQRYLNLEWPWPLFNRAPQRHILNGTLPVETLVAQVLDYCQDGER
jgi:dTMP kinase